MCIAAVLYVFRTLIERPIPLNEGCLEPLEILIPPGSMLDPQPPAAVAAGNVETSQCIVDALYGALGMLAASQGTMNNLTFGDARLQYYETICGGAGAGPDFDGCDAVQTHMTNSRLTDPEILEAQYPVLVREFAIRRGSGGRGPPSRRRRHGAAAEFRAPFSGALLANHRRIAPFGIGRRRQRRPRRGAYPPRRRPGRRHSARRRASRWLPGMSSRSSPRAAGGSGEALVRPSAAQDRGLDLPLDAVLRGRRSGSPTRGARGLRPRAG